MIRKGLTNENSAPSVSDTYTKKSKLGNNFQRKKVKPIEIGEGCITFECRKMRNGAMEDFTSEMDWDTLKIGPKSALTPTEKAKLKEQMEDDE